MSDKMEHKIEEHLKVGSQMLRPAITPHVSACIPGMDAGRFMLCTRREIVSQDKQRKDVIESRFNMYLWKLIAMTACTEYVLYRASDLLIEEETEEYRQKRVKAMDQFDKCKMTLNHIVGASEDIMLDFQGYVIRKMRKRMDAMTRAVMRGMEENTTGCNAECMAYTAVCVKLIQAFKILKHLTEKMGIVQLCDKNDYVNLAEHYLDDAHEPLCDIYFHILGENKDKEAGSPKADDQFNKFFMELCDNKLYDYCIEHARKDND